MPPQLREQFVAQMTAGASHATEFGNSGPAVPAGLPAGVGQQLKEAALNAFHIGFTGATKATLIMPMVALLIGVAFAAGMGKRAARPTTPAPEPEAEPTLA